MTDVPPGGLQCDCSLGMWVTFSFEMVRDHVSRLKSCDTAQAAFDSFADIMGEQGFPAVSAGRLPRIEDDLLRFDNFFFARGADDFIALYMAEDRVQVDPIMRHLRRTPGPFRWRDAYRDMNELEAAHIEDAKAAGLNYGIFLPMVHRPGARGIVSMGRATDFHLDTEATMVINLLGRFMFGRLEALMGVTEAQAGIDMSEREFQVLELVAIGKTNWEIGQILGVSEYSVRDHLKSLSARLETSNRTHTVVRAIQLGLLWP